MGGGLWTAMSVPLIARVGLLPTFGISCGVFMAWIAVWWFHFRPTYHLYTEGRDGNNNGNGNTSGSSAFSALPETMSDNPSDGLYQGRDAEEVVAGGVGPGGGAGRVSAEQRPSMTVTNQ